MCCLVWMLLIREFVYLTAKETHIFQFPLNTRNPYQITLNDMNMFERILHSLLTVLFVITQWIIIFLLINAKKN